MSQSTKSITSVVFKQLENMFTNFTLFLKTRVAKMHSQLLLLTWASFSPQFMCSLSILCHKRTPTICVVSQGESKKGGVLPSLQNWDESYLQLAFLQTKTSATFRIGTSWRARCIFQRPHCVLVTISNGLSLSLSLSLSLYTHWTQVAIVSHRSHKERPTVLFRSARWWVSEKCRPPLWGPARWGYDARPRSLVTPGKQVCMHDAPPIMLDRPRMLRHQVRRCDEKGNITFEWPAQWCVG